MKKFVGNVNGKSFDNEEEFQKAVSEAVKNMDENLSISSYYKYSSDDEEEDKKELVSDPRFVSTYEYFLGSKSPDINNEDEIEYCVSDELKSRIEDASNRNDIKKSLNYHINKLQETIKKWENEIEDTQKKINKLQETLDEELDRLDDTKARDEYYNKLLTIISDKEKEEEKENTQKEEKVEEKKEEVKEEKKDARSIFGMSAFDFLKQFGFIK